MTIIEKIRLGYPYPVAKLYEQTSLVTEPQLRILGFVNLCERIAQYLVTIGLSAYIHFGMHNTEVNQLRMQLGKPSFGHWIGLLKSLNTVLSDDYDLKLISSNPDVVYKNQAIEAGVQAINAVLGKKNFKNIKIHHFLDAMVEFRNKKVGHGILNLKEANFVEQPLELAINQWLEGIPIFSSQELIYVSQIELVAGLILLKGINLNRGTNLERLEELRISRDVDCEKDAVYLWLPERKNLIPLSTFFNFQYHSRIVYTFSELSKQNKPVFRCLYADPGAEEELIQSINVELILGVQEIQSDGELGESIQENLLMAGSATAATDIVEENPDPIKVQDSKSSSSSGVLDREVRDSERTRQEQPSKMPKSNQARQRIPPSSVGSSQTEETKNRDLERLYIQKEGRIETLVEIDSIIERLEREMGRETREGEKVRIQIEIDGKKQHQKNIEEELETIDSKIREITPDQTLNKPGRKNWNQGKVQQAQKGLYHLIDLFEDASFGTAIVLSSDCFERTNRQIDTMARYKGIHDELHRLEFQCYRQLAKETGSFPEKCDFFELSDCRLTLNEISARIETLIYADSLPPSKNMLEQTLPTSEAELLQRLQDAEDKLVQALEEKVLSLFIGATRQIERLLRLYLPRINKNLTLAATNLGDLLPDLTSIMERSKLNLEELEVPLEKLELLNRGIIAVGDLSRSLTSQIYSHDSWQQVDDRLRMVAADLDFLEEEWGILKRRLDDLLKDHMSEVWAVEMCRMIDRLDKIVATHSNSSQTHDLLRHFHWAAKRQFHNVDVLLKDLLDEVKNLKDPLTAILHTIYR